MVFEAETGGAWSLVCGFPDAGELAELSPETNVIIEGICYGQSKPQTNVVLGDCFVLKVGAVQTGGSWENPFGPDSRRER
jgi:hypothetical protein